MKIGVMVESFRLGLDDGLKAAADVGAQGIQMYATAGQTHFAKLDASARRTLRRKIQDAGLELAAVCGDFGGHGFAVADDNSRRIDDSKRVVDMAMELGCPIVTTHVGVIPGDSSHKRYSVIAKACEALGKYAASAGAQFAIETGPEPADVLRAFLDDVGIAKGLGVNFDPANLVMVHRANIPEAVELLGPYIVHTHAKDGLNLQPVDAEKLYMTFAQGGIEGFHAGDYIKEVPLGQGQVDWEAYLSALRQAKFDGYLTIEREVGVQPRKDISQAVEFLRRLLEQKH